MSKNQIHYKINKLLEKAPDSIYYLIYGEKSNGKSYQVKHLAIDNYLENKKKFILLRRWKADITNVWVEKYFNDVDVDKITNGKYNSITVWRGDIYFNKLDENGKSLLKEKIGTIMALSTEQHYSGASFLDYDMIIFEEFMERGAYIFHETEKLQILYSTVDRKRGTTKVFMVGNTISRICPYLKDWDLLNVVRNQKQGDINIIETGTEYETEKGTLKVTIAIEYCLSSGGKTLAFGEAKTMIDSGEWQTNKQPKLEVSRKEYKLILRIGFLYMGFKFIGELLERNKNLLWFIYPYKKEFSNDILVFSDETKESNLWQKNIYDISSLNNPDLDKILKETFRECNIFYSDDLTGTDFKQAIDFDIKK